MNIQVIESIENGPTEWGISFTCNNPEPEDYFKIPDSETAFRLKKRLESTNSLDTVEAIKQNVMAFLGTSYNPDKTTIDLADIFDFFEITQEDLIKDVSVSEDKA